jgi:hypothetical protein
VVKNDPKKDDAKKTGCIGKRAKPKPVLLDSCGREIRDIGVIKKMLQFRDEKEIEGSEQQNHQI